MPTKSTLTPELVDKFEAYWQLSGEDALTDDQICQRIGVTPGQLDGWLKRRRPVRTREDGSKETLRDIRTRARSATEIGYIQRLYGLMVKAEAAGEFKVAAQIAQWLLTKQFPRKYGNNLPAARDGNQDTGVLVLGSDTLTMEQWSKLAQKQTPAPTS
jgi:hypothetical protein